MQEEEEGGGGHDDDGDDYNMDEEDDNNDDDHHADYDDFVLSILGYPKSYITYAYLPIISMFISFYIYLKFSSILKGKTFFLVCVYV